MRRRMTAMIRYVLLLIVCCAVSMTLSFTLILHIARQSAVSTQPVHENIREAGQLRKYSNELLRLTEEYLKIVKSSSGRQWISNSFRPRLNNLRQVMLRSDLPGEHIDHLCNAADRLAAMSAKPDDLILRELAIDDVLKACNGVERFIRKKNPNGNLIEPAVVPSFQPG